MRQHADQRYVQRTFDCPVGRDGTVKCLVIVLRHKTVDVQRYIRRITSSVQYSLQKQTQELVNRYAREYSSSNHIHNLAALIADVETGEILAYAGNATFQADEKRGNQVDIITSPRSTGSILKPFLYAGMLHDGQILPSTLVSDVYCTDEVIRIPGVPAASRSSR